MFSIGNIIKVVDWEDMKSLATDIWSGGDYGENFTMCEFDDSIFNDYEGKHICGQIGIITNILKVRNIDTYEVKFFSDELIDYNGYRFEEYLLKPYKLQSDIKIILLNS